MCPLMPGQGHHGSVFGSVCAENKVYFQLFFTSLLAQLFAGHESFSLFTAFLAPTRCCHQENQHAQCREPGINAIVRPHRQSLFFANQSHTNPLYRACSPFQSSSELALGCDRQGISTLGRICGDGSGGVPSGERFQPHNSQHSDCRHRQVQARNSSQLTSYH